MARVEKLPAARADLKEIWQYIADDSPQEADQFLETLGEKMDLLSKNPKTGRERRELAPHLRSFPVGNYVIFYRPLGEGTGIKVVRVLNAAQDITEGRFEQ